MDFSLDFMQLAYTLASSMSTSSTVSSSQPLLFDPLGTRQVVADFSGGHLSSNGGALLLRQIDRGLGLSATLATCFQDARHPAYTEHSLPSLIAQRLHALALGYEDLNDHAQLRRDPLLAVCADKPDPLGHDRLHPEHRGFALASAPTLHRLELGNNKQTRAHKIQHSPAQIEATLLQMGVRCLPRGATELILDLDAMGHRLHGLQEGRHFNAYYDDWCYLPLYAFVGDVPLLAQLRTAEKEAADGVVPVLEKIIPALRRRAPHARIIVRGDSGFCREEIMAWCESQSEVYYCLGLARNARLEERLGPALADARARHCLSGATTRVFTEFSYQTRESWSRSRRVVGQAEVTVQGSNPRFVVTNLPAAGFPQQVLAERFAAGPLYEDLYCGRGEMENVLKQQVLDLKVDRLSTHHLASNQLRLWFGMFAYLLLERLRALVLSGSELAQATVGTIRLRLLKVAAAVSVSVRRVVVRLCSSCPWQALFAQSVHRLRALAPDTT
jgi:hypothetical protein